LATAVTKPVSQITSKKLRNGRYKACLIAEGAASQVYSGGFMKSRVLATFSLALTLLGCGGSVDLPNYDLEEIQPFLKAQALNGITPGDGAEPITEGNWLRLDPEATWNWQLLGQINLEPQADVYVVDLFTLVYDDSINALQDMDRKVICNFSAATYESYRPDAELYEPLLLGNAHVSFPNERWLDITDPLLTRLVVNRMNMAVAVGCDGIELDNVDGWINDTGFAYGRAEQVRFNKVLANEAHKRGLAVALKNNVELVGELADYFDLTINQSCFEFGECEGYRAMIAQGKPVLNAEYTQLHIDDPAQRELLCATSRSYRFQTIFLPKKVDGSFRISCR